MQSVSTLSSEDGYNRNALSPQPQAETGKSCKDEEDNDLTITNVQDEVASFDYIPEL